MKARWILGSLCSAMLVGLVLIGGVLIAAETDAAKEKKFEATCPVSGKPAGESHVVELPKGGGKVYFCCDNCPKAFKADPKKFETKVRRQMLETGQIVQVTCPISGEAFDKEVTVDQGHAKVHFCCKNCLAKYEKASEDERLKMVFDDLDKGFTRQVKCPVSGKPIDPEHKVEYEGKTVYFCCPNCPAAFKADPKKFLEKLPQFAKADDSEKKE